MVLTGRCTNCNKGFARSDIHLSRFPDCKAVHESLIEPSVEHTFSVAPNPAKQVGLLKTVQQQDMLKEALAKVRMHLIKRSFNKAPGITISNTQEASRNDKYQRTAEEEGSKEVRRTALLNAAIAALYEEAGAPVPVAASKKAEPTRRGRKPRGVEEHEPMSDYEKMRADRIKVCSTRTHTRTRERASARAPARTQARPPARKHARPPARPHECI